MNSTRAKWFEGPNLVSVLGQTARFLITWKTRNSQLGKEDRFKFSINWTAFDDNALHNPNRVKALYQELLSKPKTKIHPALRLCVTIISSIPLGVVELHCWQELGFKLAVGVPITIIAIIMITILDFLMRHPERTAQTGKSHPALAAKMVDTLRLSGISTTDDTHTTWEMAGEVQDAIDRASWNRVFFVTKSGYIGIGPIGTKPGDEVYSLTRGNVPFILEKMPQGDDFKLVGECYVHGVMDGEIWTERADWDDLPRMKAKARRVVLV